MNKNALIKSVCTLTFLTGTFLNYAQNKEQHIRDVQIISYNTETKLPELMKFTAESSVSEKDFAAWMNTQFKFKAGIELREYQSEQDELGFKHKRYQQYCNNYPIEGATLIAHSKQGQLESVNGEYYSEITAPVQPVLSEKQALQKALNKVQAKKYMWENKADEQLMRTAFNKPSFTYYPKGELVIVKNTENKFSLAYKFNIYAEEPLYRAYVYVDAVQGNIIGEQSILCTIDTPATADTKYSGQQSITTDSYGTSQYRLRESGRGNGIETYNCNSTTSYTNTDFTNTSTSWTGAGTNQAGTDAHWGAERTYDYFKQTFNRNSIDDKGYKLMSYVHYNKNFVNAFWDGQRMTYGDGDPAKGFGVMTGLDVCGHEITHGLVSNTASLGNGEAGALNESFADIFGTCIEKFARPNNYDWKMGPELMTNGKGIRDMSDPNSLQQPDTYKGTYWDAGGEVHINDGPCNYWFYLMCQGGSGTNDINNAYNVTAIGMEDAAKIAYRGLTKYFTSSTNYSSARTYTLKAAVDLFGDCSPQVIACANAWYAVGVGTQYNPAAVTAGFSAAQTNSCTLPSTISFTNTTTYGATYQWDFGDGTTSTQVNPSHTYTQAGTYTVKLSAVGCTNTQDQIVKNAYITINPPAAPTATDGLHCGPGEVLLSANGAGTLVWYDAQGNQVGTGATYTTPILTTTATYYVASSISQAAVTGGPATNTTLGGGSYLNFTHYLVFDALDGLTIKNVDVYTQSAGNRTIELQDANGTILLTKTVNLTNSGKNTVALDFHVNSGIGYRLAATGTTIDMYRNNAGAVYPIAVGSLVSITGTDVSASNPAYYYYFYNWEVQKDPCVSATVSAIATIDPCIGIGELSLQNIQIMPNPAADIIYLSNCPKNMQLKIIDQTARLVQQESTQGVEQYKLDISALANGIYYLQLFSDSGTITKKIRVQH